MGMKFRQIFDKYTFSVVMAFIGVVFFAVSLFLPPCGQIDPSVLTAVGELFGFTAAVSGIHQYGQNARMKYTGNTNEE